MIKMANVTNMRVYNYHKNFFVCLVWCKDDNKYHVVDTTLSERTGKFIIVDDNWMIPTYSYMNAINFYEKFIEDFKRTYN